MIDSTPMQLFDELLTIARKDTKRSLVLIELRERLARDDASLRRLKAEVTPTQLGVLYVTKKLLNDLWVNFAVDASFPFPEEHQLMQSIGEEMRRFVLEVGGAAKEGKELMGMTDFGKAVRDYFDLVDSVDKELMDRAPVA